MFRTVSVNLNHTCLPGEATRKRNVPTKRLARTSEAVHQFQPGNKKAGNAERFQDTAKASFGVDAKAGQAGRQAHKAVNTVPCPTSKLRPRQVNTFGFLVSFSYLRMKMRMVAMNMRQLLPGGM